MGNRGIEMLQLTPPKKFLSQLINGVTSLEAAIFNVIKYRRYFPAITFTNCNKLSK